MKRPILSIAILCSCVLPSIAQRYDNYCPPDKNVTLTQSTLPIVKIDVNGNEIQRRNFIDGRLTIIDSGEGNTNYADTGSSETLYDGSLAIKYTGSSTFTNSDKKSYILKTPDHTWELKAENADRSMTRSVIAYSLASQFNRIVPSQRLCEVIIDGTYYGVYHLYEPITASLGEDDILVSVDRNDGGQRYTSAIKPVTSSGTTVNSASTNYKFIYPDNASQLAPSLISAVELAMTGGDTYSAINVTDFADYLLASEFAHNADSYRLHSLMCFPDGDKATMIPGDASLGFGNYDAFESFRSDTWVYDSNDILAPQDEPQLVPAGWYYLIHNPDFQSLLKKRWEEYRKETYTEENIASIIDRNIEALKASGALQRDSQAWATWSRKLWPNYYLSTSIDDEVAYLKRWIGERLEWMDENIGSGEVVEPYDPTAYSEVNPIKILSGFNTDCIAESQDATPKNAASHPALDGHGSVLITRSVSPGGNVLPDDGKLICDNGHSFQLGDYSANNCLYLDRTGSSGTLEFAEHIAADSLCILLVGTNRDIYDLKYTVTVNYTDGTTDQTDPQFVSDWCVEDYGDFVYRDLNRWRADFSGGGVDGTLVNLSENQFKVNKDKNIKSVTLVSQCSQDTWGYGMLGIFAVSALQRKSAVIEEITMTEQPKVIKAIYGLDGRLRTKLHHGINIVIYTDGTSGKLLGE